MELFPVQQACACVLPGAGLVCIRSSAGMRLKMKQKVMSVFMAATLIIGANQFVTPTAAIKTASAAGNVASAALGNVHSAAVLKNGGLYCWGSNDAGQIGDASEEQQDKPVHVLDNVASATLGTAHSAAITKMVICTAGVIMTMAR